MSDTPTPPLPLGDVIKLLRGRADALRWDVAHQTKIGHEVTAYRMAQEEQQYLAAATTLEGLEAVMRDPVLDFALQYVSEERLIDLYSGLPPEGIHAAVFVRQRASELRARLRSVVGTGTPEEESDG